MATEQRYTLKDLVSPEVAALVVVDVQNDFCHEDGWSAQRGHNMSAAQQAVDRTVSLIDEARRFQVPVLFVRTTHDKWNNSDVWVGRGGRPVVENPSTECVTGTWGTEFYKVQPDSDEYVCTKHRYSAFTGTDLEMTLRTLRRQSVLITGVTTNACVEFTAREAFMREFHVVLVQDCTAAPTDEEHQATVFNVRRYFGQVADSPDVVARWSGETDS